MPDAIEKNVETPKIPVPTPPKNGTFRKINPEGIAELVTPTNGIVRSTSSPETTVDTHAREVARRLLGNRPMAGTIAERLSSEQREEMIVFYDKLEAELMNTISIEDYESGKRVVDSASHENFLPQELAAFSIISDVAKEFGTDDGIDESVADKIFEFKPSVHIEDKGGDSKIQITNELNYIAYEVRGDDDALKVLILERASEARGNATFVLRNDNGELEHSSILTDLFAKRLSRAELRKNYENDEGQRRPVNPQRPVNHDYYNEAGGIDQPKYERYISRIVYWATCPMDKFRHGSQSVPRSFGKVAANAPTGGTSTP